MAHKKAGGSSRNGRDSAGRRLGVKLYGGETAVAGIRDPAVPVATRQPAVLPLDIRQGASWPHGGLQVTFLAQQYSGFHKPPNGIGNGMGEW